MKWEEIDWPEGVEDDLGSVKLIARVKDGRGYQACLGEGGRFPAVFIHSQEKVGLNVSCQTIHCNEHYKSDCENCSQICLKVLGKSVGG